MADDPQPPEIPFARAISLSIPADAPALEPILLLDFSRRTAWIDIALLALLIAGFETCAGLLLSMMDGAEKTPAMPEVTGLEAVDRVRLLPLLVIRAFGAVAAIAAILHHRRQSVRSLGLKMSAFWLDIGIGFGAVGITYGLILMILLILGWFWPEAWEQMHKNAERIIERIPRMTPLESAPVALTIGVYEELVFRGFLLTRLRRALGHWFPAVLLSTAVFTSLHAFDQEPMALVFVTVLSLVFSLVTIWRRSIVPAIVGHFLFNWSQFIVLYYQAGDAWK